MMPGEGMDSGVQWRGEIAFAERQFQGPCGQKHAGRTKRKNVAGRRGVSPFGDHSGVRPDIRGLDAVQHPAQRLTLAVPARALLPMLLVVPCARRELRSWYEDLGRERAGQVHALRREASDHRDRAAVEESAGQRRGGRSGEV